MEDIKKYKFKNKYLNYFFWQNDVFFIKVKENDNKITYTEMKKDSKNIITIIIDQKIRSIKEDKRLRKLAFSIIDNIKKPDYLYTNMRLDFKSQSIITISNKMCIKLKPIDTKIKNALIVYNYFKFKELIEKQSYNTFYEQYKAAGVNETQTQVLKHKKGNIEDYFYIGTLKNIIRIYKKEVDSKIDYNNPSFKDKMLFEYLNNYFSKFAVVVYDQEKVKKFISNYYVTEVQSEDQVVTFINNFLSFYKLITNNKFSYKNNYKFNLKDCMLFNNKKAENIKYRNFYNYFDDIMVNKNNYDNFMFMLEILDLNEHISAKKKIINYISVLELLLVKGNNNISTQLQTKCINLLKGNKYSQNEIKLAYDYRSKIIHGEYEEAVTKLHHLSLINDYKFTKEELEYEIYLNFEQMIEQRLSERLYIILKVALRYFIFKNNSIIYLKQAI